MRPTRTASAKIPRQIAHPVGREPKGSNSPHMRDRLYRLCDLTGSIPVVWNLAMPDPGVQR